MIYEQEQFIILNFTRIKIAIQELEQERKSNCANNEYATIMRELNINVIGG